MSARKKLLLILLVCFANFWIWRVLGRSLLLGLVIILLSVSLTLKSKFVTIALFLVLSLYLLKTNPDTNLMYISPLERHWAIKRQEYYSGALGKLYRNRIGLYISHQFFPYFIKYQSNIAYNLDPSLYFFANHPRERSGIIEFEKFPAIFLPLFITGVAVFLSGRNRRFWVTYLIVAIVVGALVFPGYDLGPLLIFPFVALMIYLGAEELIDKLK